MIKKTKIIAAIFLTAGIILAGAALYLSSFSPKAGMYLQNFIPGSNVNYEVLADGRKVAEGNQIVAEDGTLTIPPPQDKSATRTIEYGFSIQEPESDEIVDLSVILDAPSQNISVKSRGMQSYADIKVTSDKIFVQSKADWSGNFTTINPFTNDEPEMPGSFEVSFMGSGLGDALRTQNPHIIQVIVADDENGFVTGGDPPTHSWTDSDEPNQHTDIFPAKDSYVGIVYNETYCGDPKISVCERQDMAKQIQKVVENYVRAIMLMTEEFSTVMMQQATMVGMFFDAKQQIETQRETRRMVNEAHKSYHPSDQMCRFGTFMRSVSDTEERGRFNQAAFNEAMFSAYSNQEHRASAEGYAIDIESRMRQFREHYCDPDDNGLDGLKFMCDHEQDAEEGAVGAENKGRINNDIDYTRIFEAPLTLNVDFTNSQDPKGTEEDVLALARNLYYPRAIDGETAKELLDKYPEHQDWRAYIATQSAASNSMAEIIKMKTAAASDGLDTTGQNQDAKKGWHFMKILLKDMGLQENEINKLVGENPSYYAQMEILTKKIYQDPDFYTNLYDKPANIDRISASMDAIKLMQGRDRYENSLRREILTSLLLEQALRTHINKVNAELESVDSRL